MASAGAEKHGLGLDISFCDIFPSTVSAKSSNDKIRRACGALGIPLRELGSVSAPSCPISSAAAKAGLRPFSGMLAGEGTPW